MYKRFASSVAVSAVVCMLVVGALRPTVAHAQWIYESSPSQDFFRNLGGVMVSAAQLHADMQEMSAQIEAARQRFFSAPVGSTARAKAGKEFSKLLDDKDLMYGLLLFQRGPGNDLASLIAQPFIDHGIPVAAGGAYLDWIVAVRRSMGAKADNQFLWNFSAELLGPALKQNLAAYVAYRKIRDKSEFDAWDRRNGNVAPYVSTDGGKKLVRVLLATVPEAVKATLRDSRQFEGWEKATYYKNADGTKYLVAFDEKWQYTFDDKGQPAKLNATSAEDTYMEARNKRSVACQSELQKLQLGKLGGKYMEFCMIGHPPSSAQILQWQRESH